MRGELEGVPRNSRFLLTIGRLKNGVTTASAEADLRALAGGLAAAFPDSNKDWMPVVTAALPALTQQARPRLLLLFGGVVVVLGVGRGGQQQAGEEVKEGGLFHHGGRLEGGAPFGERGRYFG